MLDERKNVIASIAKQSIIVLFVATFLSACTDYVQQIEDRYGEWGTSDEVSSSSSVKAVDPADVVVGSMTDSRDGQTYKTVSIGTQTWMAQNLNYKTENSYCYNDDSANCTKYGRLYTWAAAMDSAGTWSSNGKGCGYNKSCSPTYPVRGVCPEGWHLPSRKEWDTLFTSVGGMLNAGKVLKFSSSWNSGGDGLDAFSFSALPAGHRSNYANYYYEGDYAYFWSSFVGGKYKGDYMYLYKNDDEAYFSDYDKNYAFSVRCIQDEALSENINSSLDSITDARDGQIYKTVKIGSQIWMAQNLNYEIAYSYCYNGKVDNCSKYGRLYTWAAAMDSAGVYSSDGEGCGYGKTCSPKYPVQGVCPEGWHLPSKTEWDTLFTFVGGISIAGKVLKSNSGWKSRVATDAFLFSGLPAGLRYHGGSSEFNGYNAYFWSSTQYNSDRAYHAALYYSNDDAFLNEYDKNCWFSVRCLKD